MKLDYFLQNAKFCLELRWKTWTTSFAMTPALRFLSFYCKTRFPHPDLIQNIHAHLFPLWRIREMNVLKAGFLCDCVGVGGAYFAWNVGLLTHRMLEADATEQGLGLCPGVRTWLEYLLWKVASVSGKWLIHYEEFHTLQGSTLRAERASLRKPDWKGLRWSLRFPHSLDCEPS